MRNIIGLFIVVVVLNTQKPGPTQVYVEKSFIKSDVSIWIQKALLGHASTMYANHLWLKLNEISEIKQSSSQIDEELLANKAYELAVMNAHFIHAHRYTTTLLSTLFGRVNESIEILFVAYALGVQKALDDLILLAWVYERESVKSVDKIITVLDAKHKKYWYEVYKNISYSINKKEQKHKSLQWLLSQNRNENIKKLLKVRIQQLENR
jgi:hypothetical protein